MPIRDRLGAAFKRVGDRLQPPRIEHKSVGAALAPSGGVLGTPFTTLTDGDAAQQLKHFSGWVYVAVHAIAQRIGGQEVSVARAPSGLSQLKALKSIYGGPRRQKAVLETLKPLDSHPFLDLVDDPNDAMQWANLIFSWVASLSVTGRGVLMFDLEDGDQVWPIPTSWLTPIHQPTAYAEWRVQPPAHAGVLYVPGELMPHVYYPHPADPFGALSPLQAAADAVVADASIQRSQARAFQNGIYPGLAIIAGDVETNYENARPIFEEEQRAQIINAIRARYRGVERAGEPFILDGLIRDIKKISNTPNEMDWLNSSNLTKERIMQAFGVNPIIVGQIEASSRAASAEADRHFCNSTVNPIIQLLSQCLSAWAGPLFSTGEKLVIWIEPCHPRDTEEQRANTQLLLSTGNMTGNEARNILMGLPPLPGRDTPLVPMNLMPDESS